MKYIIKIVLASVAFLIIHSALWLNGFWKADFSKATEFRKDIADFIDINWYHIKKGFNITTVKSLLIIITLGSMIYYVVSSLYYL